MSTNMRERSRSIAAPSLLVFLAPWLVGWLLALLAFIIGRALIGGGS